MQTPDQYLLDLPELQERDRPTFENFVPGRNAPALAAICEMAAGRGPRLLYLYGVVGVGLSHLLSAFSEGRSETERVPAYESSRNRYAVDDVELLDATGAEALRRLLDAVLGSAEGRIVCAGHVSPNRLPLPENVRSRIAAGLCYRIEPLGEADCFRELGRLAALRGIVLTEDIAAWMSMRLPRDMRTLTRVLDIANQLSLHAKSCVDLAAVKEAARIAIESGFLEERRPGASPAALEARLSAYIKGTNTLNEE